MTPGPSTDRGKKESSSEVIDLWLSDSDSDSNSDNDNDRGDINDARESKAHNKRNDRKCDGNSRVGNGTLSAYKKIQTGTADSKSKAAITTKARTKTTISQGLQAGLVLEEDIFAAVSNDDDRGNRKAPPNVLFEDPEFGPMASSIQGVHKVSIADAIPNGAEDQEKAQKWRPKCRCNLLSALSYNKDGRPHFSCGKHSAINKTNKKGRKCNFFAWAFRAELVPWYRFGSHNQHVLVRKDGFGAVHDDHSTELSSATSSLSPSIFSAQDLVQGKVGDCWFLSALAVVAERSDLVKRLFQRRPGQLQNEREDDQRGIVRVNLFLDGIWTPITLDNFLPCYPGGDTSRKEEEELQKAIEASLLDQSTHTDNATTVRNPYAKPKKLTNSPYNTKFPPAASENDPHGLSETNLRVMRATANFLEKDYRRRGLSGHVHGPVFLHEGRNAQTSDLAYSKARRNQLWVPLLEKAYAKIHGSYQAISGGHVAEAFLDLTGAPTLQIVWHAGHAAAAGSSSVYEDPRKLWEDLKRWRRKKLPMGCGTDRSAGGLIGMHAYSILDIQELTNVDVEFFRDHLVAGTLGNVSGFTEYDGKLRLLRVRNPHGQGEWKGEFSDKCKTWQKLLASSGISLPRTMANDGTFWIGYDDFLLGFSNIDVVLAFEGNHAKSFVSNFPPKKSNHRCQRAFEVSLLDPQPGLETKDRVEVYVMGIQKSKRGARQGRADRKKSYKVSDLGILVGEYPLEESGNVDEDNHNPSKSPFSAIHGQMFGFNRNGHYKLVLDRRKCKRLVVMPISFGHPAATDEFRSFVVRFNADAPLMIRELETAPRMDRVLGSFLMSPKSLAHFANTRQGQQTVLWKNSWYKVVQINCLGNGGGTVFVYLCAHSDAGRHSTSENGSSTTLGIEATCRGMSCRVAEGLLDHETTAKGKKFQASWRKYTASFAIEAKSERRSRLLMTLYQSGQDTEMGSIECKSMGNVLGNGKTNATSGMTSTTLEKYWQKKDSSYADDGYKELGIFHPIAMDANNFQQSVSVSSEVKIDFGAYEESVDKELEKAIALSRGDAIAIDSKDSVTFNEATEDAILQEALELSRKDADATRNRNETKNLDPELEDALRRSYQEAVTTVSESERVTPTKRRRKEEAARGEVLDLVGDEGDNNKSNDPAVIAICETKIEQTIDLTAGEDVVQNRTTSEAEVVDLVSPKKRVNSEVETKNDTVFVIVESSDDEDEVSDTIGNENKEDLDSKVKKDFPPSDSNERTMENSHKNDSREKKRKLAAEAALRRLKKWS